MKGLGWECKLVNSNNPVACNLSGGSLRPKLQWRAWNTEKESGKKNENFWCLSSTILREETLNPGQTYEP